MFLTTQQSATNLAAALVDSKVNSSGASAGKAFMKFAFQTGGFSFGRDQIDISGEAIVINTYSIQHGWTLWVNSSPQKELVPFSQDLPFPMEAQQGNTPTEARAFEARFADDEDTILVFETNSYGGRSGVDKLLNEIRGRALKGETEYLFPKVKLNSTSYKSKQGSTIHNPIFEVVEWVNGQGEPQEVVEAIQDNSPEAEAPTTRRRRAS